MWGLRIPDNFAELLQAHMLRMGTASWLPSSSLGLLPHPHPSPATQTPVVNTPEEHGHHPYPKVFTRAGPDDCPSPQGRDNRHHQDSPLGYPLSFPKGRHQTRFPCPHSPKGHPSNYSCKSCLIIQRLKPKPREVK